MKTNQKKVFVIIIDSNDVKYYTTCFENINLFKNDDVKFDLNRFSTNKINDFDEYKFKFEISIDLIVFIDFVTRKRITQILTTLNVKKFKLNESNNFETIETKKKIIIKKIMKKKLRYKKH